jgi:hypothetical protein
MNILYTIYNIYHIHAHNPSISIYTSTILSDKHFVYYINHPGSTGWRLWLVGWLASKRHITLSHNDELAPPCFLIKIMHDCMAVCVCVCMICTVYECIMYMHFLGVFQKRQWKPKFLFSAIIFISSYFICSSSVIYCYVYENNSSCFGFSFISFSEDMLLLLFLNASGSLFMVPYRSFMITRRHTHTDTDTRMQ